MFSYQHAFHAGNIADIHKHLCLTWCLETLNQKVKPYTYIDTHAGAGRYVFKKNSATRGQNSTARSQDSITEQSMGIDLLWAQKNWPSSFESYQKILQKENPQEHVGCYPGSPWIAKHLLRAQDTMHYIELQPTTHRKLRHLFKNTDHAYIHCRDGFEAAYALIPPQTARGLVMIDPAYELKSDFNDVAECVTKTFAKWRTGLYLIWYPILRNQRTDLVLKRKCMQVALGERLCSEWLLPPSEAYFNLVGSGVIIMNPPWKIDEKLVQAANFLQKIGAIKHATLTR